MYDQKHLYSKFLKTFEADCKPDATFLAFSPRRALLAAMARRAGATRPKATAHLQKLFIRFQAAWQIAVTQ